MSGHRRQVIESWIESVDEFGVGEGQWIPTKESFAWVCELALKGLDAARPEEQAHIEAAIEIMRDSLDEFSYQERALSEGLDLSGEIERRIRAQLNGAKS